jgi:hypothetical protein
MTLGKKYQFVRPEKNIKSTRGTITLILKEKNYEIHAEFGIRLYIESADFSIAVFVDFCTRFPRFHQRRIYIRSVWLRNNLYYSFLYR